MELKTLIDEQSLTLSNDFLSKGRNRLVAAQRTQILNFFRPKIKEAGFFLPDDYFERPIYAFYQLRFLVDPLSFGDSFENDLTGLPTAERHIASKSRKVLLNRLGSFAASQERRLFFITGEEGRGKTVLISKFLRDEFPDVGLRPIYIDCRTEITFSQFVGRLCNALVGLRSGSQFSDSVADQIRAIRRSLERTKIFLVLDNYEYFSVAEEGGYHAIRADNFIDFALELIDSDIDIKLLIASTHVPERISGTRGFNQDRDSAQAPPIAAKEWLAVHKTDLKGEPEPVSEAINELIDQIGDRDIPGPLYSLAWIALRYSSSPATRFELAIRLMRRSYRGVVKQLIAHMPRDHVIIFHLLALSEDGLKPFTLEKILNELAVVKADGIRETICDFRKRCSPILTEVPQEDTIALELNGVVRRTILKLWDSKELAPEAPLHENIAAKRNAHRIIARIALHAAIDNEMDQNAAKKKNLIQQRYIQAYIHLLASLNPWSFRHLGAKRFSPGGRGKALRSILDRVENDADCIEAAIFIWNLLQGWRRQINEIDSAAVDLSCADDIKVDLLLKTFHIGFSYHTSDRSNDQLRSRLPPDLERIGIETGTLPGLRDLFSSVFMDLSYSAFRAHRTDIANCAIDRGKILIESNHGKSGLGYEEQYFRLLTVHLELLMRNGRLEDVESLAKDYTYIHFREYLRQKISEHRRVRKVRKKRNEYTQIGSRKSFEQLVFSAIGNIKLHAKLTESYLLQGRIHRAALESQQCIKFFPALRDKYQLKISEFGSGDMLVRNPMKYRPLLDLVRKNIFRITIRSVRMKEYCPDFLLSNEQIAVLNHSERIEENVAAMNLIKRNADRISTHAARRNEFDEDSLAGLDFLMWLRYKFDDIEAGVKTQYLNALKNGAERILDGLWIGNVSPMNKIDAMLERARILWLLAQVDLDNADSYIPRTVDTLRWVCLSSNHHRYPLSTCDANLLLVELADYCALHGIELSEPLDRVGLISRCVEIIEKHNYGLRWPEYDILANSSEYVIPPSRVLVC